MMTFFTAQVRKIGAKSVHLINVSYGHTRVHWHKKNTKTDGGRHAPQQLSQHMKLKLITVAETKKSCTIISEGLLARCDRGANRKH